MAEERVYLIRVSAVLDRSTAAAVGDFVQQHDRAQRTTERRTRETADRAKKTQREVADSSAKEQERAAKAIEKSQADIAKQFERNTQRRATDEDRARQRQVREDQRAFDQRIKAAEAENRKKEKLRRDEERDIIQEAKRAEKREEAAAKRATALAKSVHEERKQQVKKLASDVYRDTAAIVGKAVDVGGRIAGGMGVNFDVGAGVSKAVQLERMAVGIVNAGNRGTGSAAGRDAEVKRLQTSAREVGNKYAFDPTAMLSGYAQFQAKTGDTATATAGMDRFARLAKAFNVELNDMISAAGEVSSKLEDSFTPGEKRAQKTYEILKMLTAQGQEGAIEIADLAKETARIGGGAGFFKGDIGSTIGKLGALAQLARQTGGANSPADAARSVAAFVTTLKTPARRAAFDANNVAYKDADGSFLDPFTIIKNALRATGGDTEKMNNMFKSSLGEKSVASLSKAYNQGGKGDAGIAAVDALFSKFMQTVDDKTIDENKDRAMNTTESKAVLFQNKLDLITASLADRVLPAFEKMAPDIEKVAKAFADVVVWAAENPGKMIVGAIIASIAKATLGALLGEALAKAIAGSSLKIPMPGAGGSGGMGAAGGAVAIAAVAAAGYAGYQALKSGFNEGARGQDSTLSDDARTSNALSDARAAKRGAMSPAEALKRLEEAQAITEKRIKGAGKTGYLDAINPFSDATFADAGRSQQDAYQAEDANGNKVGPSKTDTLKEDLANVTAAIESMKAQMAADAKAVKHVHVDNPSAPPNGVAGVPDH